MSSVRWISALSLSLLATPTLCAAPPATGFYAGLGLGQSRYGIDFAGQVERAYEGTAFAVTGASTGRMHDTAYRVLGGYQFSPYVAIEGGWQHLGSVNGSYALQTVHADTFARNAEWKLSGFNATLVGTYPFAERFAAIGKLGAFFSKLEFRESTTSGTGARSTFNAPDDNGAHFMWGAGGSYQITDHVALRLDWDRIEGVGRTFALTDEGNGRFSHVDMWSAALIWRF